ncbi:ABC transporter permease [Corynebacterium aquilae]|uniref:ABC transporter permease n=1 Tax=Corynebacterium aquilae DSM 44791 TaxID=1431546 RepID=A0A1L7CDW6_9CORY|nr:ABC transporter permease [Corynebacterium aquilae]APT84041.1 hypothetical protein CAQU_01970 [Corynebacterium aquilae DSM 44791]
MNFMEALSLAGGSLRNNKMRSLLTLLGVIIGIAAVIAILTLGSALQKQTMGAFEGAGATDLQLQVVARDNSGEEEEGVGDAAEAFGASAVIDDDSKFTPDDVEQLREAYGDRLAGISISGDGYVPSQVTRLDDNDVPEGKASTVYLESYNTDGLRMNGDDIAYGRGYTEQEVESNAMVAVANYALVDKMFNGDPASALGKSVQVETESGDFDFQIIGVQKKPESIVLDGFANLNLVIPYTTAAEMNDQPLVFGTVSIRPKSGEDKEVLIKQIQGWLDKHWADDEAARVKITDFSKQLESFTKVLGAISMVISSIAGISLLVGGIGIMNIMLVTVTERTREIGIRKALGATRGAIRLQFVIEAMMVCLLGGIIGVLLGGGVGMVGAKLMGHMVWPPITGVLFSLGFSLAIGLFFGFYPANKAAKMDPIEALRHE